MKLKKFIQKSPSSKYKLLLGNSDLTISIYSESKMPPDLCNVFSSFMKISSDLKWQCISFDATTTNSYLSGYIELVGYI